MKAEKTRLEPQRLPKEVIRRLEEIVGPEWVSEDRAIIEAYTILCIEAGAVLRKVLKDPTLLPACVVIPETTEEVQAIVRLANRHKVPFLPFTSGQILSASIVPGTICIYFSRMNRILDIDEKNMSMTIQPFVDYVTVQAETRRRALWNGGSGWHSAVARPASQCGTAGIWQTDLKYGGLARNILGLKVVLPTGELMRVGSSAIAGTGEFSFADRFPGPNLYGLYKGSLGTRGIVTEITIKLHPWVGGTTLPEDIGSPSLATYFEDAKKKKFDIPSPPKRHKVFWFEYPDAERLKKGVSEIACSGIGIGLNITGLYNTAMCSRTKEEAEKRMKEKFFPPNSGYVVIAGISSERQMVYEEKVLRHIIKETGGRLLSDDYKPEVLEALAPWNLEFCVNTVSGMRCIRSGYMGTMITPYAPFENIDDSKEIWGEVVDEMGAPTIFSNCGREMPYGYISDRGHQIETEMDHFIPSRADRKGMGTVIDSMGYAWGRYIQKGYQGCWYSIMGEPFTTAFPDVSELISI